MICFETNWDWLVKTSKQKKTIWWNFWFVILIQKRKEGFEFPHMDYNTNS